MNKRSVHSLTQNLICNHCGKGLDFFDLQNDFSIHKRIGYGSVHDGDDVHMRLCSDCFDKLVEECEVSPIEEMDG